MFFAGRLIGACQRTTSAAYFAGAGTSPAAAFVMRVASRPHASRPSRINSGSVRGSEPDGAPRRTWMS